MMNYGRSKKKKQKIFPFEKNSKALVFFLQRKIGTTSFLFFIGLSRQKESEGKEKAKGRKKEEESTTRRSLSSRSLQNQTTSALNFF